jgi:hypothetical protein
MCLHTHFAQHRMAQLQQLPFVGSQQVVPIACTARASRGIQPDWYWVDGCFVQHVGGALKCRSRRHGPSSCCVRTVAESRGVAANDTPNYEADSCDEEVSRWSWQLCPHGYSSLLWMQLLPGLLLRVCWLIW